MRKRALESAWVEVKAKAYHRPDGDVEDEIEKEEDGSDDFKAPEAIIRGYCGYNVRNALYPSVLVTCSEVHKRSNTSSGHGQGEVSPGRMFESLPPAEILRKPFGQVASITFVVLMILFILQWQTLAARRHFWKPIPRRIECLTG